MCQKNMNKFTKKRILLLCKETFSYPLYFLANRWKEENTVAAYFFMPPECMYNQCILNQYTYYAFKKCKNIRVYDSKEICKKFTENRRTKNFQYDKKKLHEIEEKYTHFRNLNLQIMSTQLLTRHYHNRNYMKPCIYEEQIQWLLLNYERVFEIFEEFQPDMILDLDDAELPRTVINEIAYVKKIPYITIDHPRYELYKLYTYQMGIGIDSYFKTAFEKNLQESKENFKEEIEYIQTFRRQHEIMSKEFKNTITAQYEKEGFIKSAKTFIAKLNYFLHQDYIAKNIKLKKTNALLYPNSKDYIQFYASYILNRNYLLGRNRFFHDPIEGEPYVYMPLHLIPESTTFVKAPFYVNELEVIEAVSKALPCGWKIYVKEHQAMLGERSFSFYERVNQIPNVRLVQVNYYRDPKPWIVNAKGVITITGTSAYEAALLGKPALVFGEVPFTLIEGITKVNSYEELPYRLKNFRNIENQLSCAAYIKTVKEYGETILLKYLMSEGEDILSDKIQMSDRYQHELDKLEQFYQRAYENYGIEYGK